MHEPGMPTTFQVNGQEFELRYPLRVLKDLQRDHNIHILRGGEEANQVIRDPEKIAVVISYGLRAKHGAEYTPEWVEDNIDAATLISVLMPALTYAMTGQRPRDEPSPNGAGATVDGSTG